LGFSRILGVAIRLVKPTVLLLSLTGHRGVVAIHAFRSPLNLISIKMRRALRIAVELTAPPLFGAVLLSIPAVSFDARNALSMIGLLFMTAYKLAAIPSIGYTLCMEIAFAAGLDPKKKKAVALSALLGFLAGLAMLPWARGGDFIRIKTGALALLPPAGLIVGILVGTVVRVIDRRHKGIKGA